MLESHLSFPVVSFHRSQHDNQSWLAALTVVLDSCALLLAVAKDTARFEAQLTFAVARHAAVDLALVFQTPPEVDRLPGNQLLKLRELLGDAGVAVHEGPAACAKLAELRGLDEPFVYALARYFLFALPPVLTDRLASTTGRPEPGPGARPASGNCPR